ncbi:MAG TPA: class I SAM-dependent methyltransferase [Vicinamibacterales bacterium]|nr:class I SAM-dependent methyltransferase [Vicinamibacterales bacterium]
MLTSSTVPGINEWQSVATNAGADDLREHILTGYKSGKPFTPYVPTIPVPSSIDWVLDFGCGVGRSFPYLKSIARHVVGFDLPPMIVRCRGLASAPVDLLSDNWALASSRRFDMIFAALVLQHVEPDACRGYLADFARIAPVTYLLTRLQSDFDENVLAIVTDSRLFDVEACAEVEHDASTHTLRQVGQPSFTAISRAADNRHYEVRLRSALTPTQTR